MIPGKNYSPEELLGISWRWKWPLLALTVLGALGGYAFSRTLPVQFQAEATIMAYQPRVDLSRLSALGRPDDRLRNLVQDIRSRPRLEGIILENDLYPDLRARGMTIDRVVDRMRRDLDTRPTGADTLVVGFISGDPSTALKVTQRLVEVSLEATKEVPRDDLKVQRQLLERKIEDARVRLEELERKLEDYKRQHAGQLPEQRLSNQQILQTTQMQLQALQDSLDRDKDRRSVMDREAAGLAAVDAAGEQAPAPPVAGSSIAVDQLETARGTLKDLLARYRDEHPDVMQARRRVRDLEAQVQREASGRPSVDGSAATQSRAEIERQNRLRQLRLDIEGLDRQIALKQSEERALRGKVSAVQINLEVTPTRESEMVGLTRDYTMVSQFYNSLVAQREQTGMAQDTVELPVNGQFKVIDPARLPLAPIGPNRPKITAAGAIAGLLLAVALVAFVEYRDSAFRTEEEVSACIGLPVIAMIPLMAPEKAAESGPRLKRWLGPLAGNTLPEAVGRR